ncbi:MAG: flavodoxin family protein [Anaerolineae bacterium]|nr:flavodoxin family protein [Anaerolineae bacterium]
MKVIGIVGSPRIGGNTEQLTQEALRVVQEHGIDTELIRLAEKEILPCTACGACENEETCTLDDDLLSLYHLVKQADALILASPVFFGSATPQLKAFMDRAGYISYNNGFTFARKVGGPLVVAGRNGGNFTNTQLILWFLILGMIVPGSTDWNTAFGSAPGDIWKDTSGIDNVRNFASNLAWLVKKLGKPTV